MIRKVAAHVYDFGKKCWRVHLLCGHVVITSRKEHDRKVKGRFCPSCPGADLAMMADYRNEAAEQVRFGRPDPKVLQYRWDLVRGLP